MKYLVVGGYAVAYYSYPRTTGEIDIWVERSASNAANTVDALRAFGFDMPQLGASLFMQADKLVRLGYPPLRVELMTSISGVAFETCYVAREEAELGGVRVSMIGLPCLKRNKLASGRHKDLSDLDHLP